MHETNFNRWSLSVDCDTGGDSFCGHADKTSTASQPARERAQLFGVLKHREATAPVGFKGSGGGGASGRRFDALLQGNDLTARRQRKPRQRKEAERMQHKDERGRS